LTLVLVYARKRRKELLLLPWALRKKPDGQGQQKRGSRMDWQPRKGIFDTAEKYHSLQDWVKRASSKIRKPKGDYRRGGRSPTTKERGPPRYTRGKEE